MILDWEDVAMSHPLRKKKGLRILGLEDYIIGADNGKSLNPMILRLRNGNKEIIVFLPHTCIPLFSRQTHRD